MNRGVMVTRGEPNKEELILSAKYILLFVKDVYSSMWYLQMCDIKRV